MGIVGSIIGVGFDVALLLYIMKRYKSKYCKLPILIYCICYMVIVIILNNVMGSSMLRLPIYCFMVGILIYWLYDETSVFLSLKMTATYFVIMQISEVLIFLSVLCLGDYDLYIEVLGGDEIKTFSIIFISKFMNLIMASLLERIQGCNKEKTARSISILFPLIIALLSLNLNTTLLLETKEAKSILGAIITTSLVIFASMSYAIFFEYYKKAKDREVLIGKLVLQNREQYKLFQEKMSNDQRIKKMHHDMKNHMMYLRYCFEKDDIEKGIEYTDGLLEQLTSYSVSLHTGNGMLDCLISEMKQRCTEAGILFEIDINLNEQCFMNDFDICTLFGNILNNAFEATLKLNERSSKPIIFKMSTIDNYIVIKETNYMVMKEKEKSNIFMATTKEDKENHGLGLKNIEDVIEKYNGIKKISVDKDLFTLKVMFPIMHISKSAS